MRCAFFPFYQSSFSANCIERLSAIVVVMRPTVGEPMFAFGKPNCGRVEQVEGVGPELQPEAS